jgi:hypothetical protein
MKQTFIALLTALCLLPGAVFAQLTEQQAMQQIALTPVVLDNNIPAGAYKLLSNKMSRIAAKHGCVANENGRYIITCSADVLGQEITPTAPVMHVYNVQVTFYVGDGIDGVLYSSYAVETKGVGQTPEKAYIDAFKNIKENDPGFKMMLDKGKAEILVALAREEKLQAQKEASERAERAAQLREEERRQAAEQEAREQREIEAEEAARNAARNTNAVCTAAPEPEQKAEPAAKKEAPAKKAELPAKAKPNYQVKGKWFK